MRGKRLTIYLGESDQWHHRPLYLAILEHLRTAGLAGATVTRGIAGFGAHSKIKTARLLELSVDLPIVITAVDRAERIERVLPEVAAMMAAGVMTVDDTEVHFYSAAFAGGLPAVSVGDVMTRDPEAVTPETPIADVVARLLARDFTALPVVDADGRVVGMIADSDLLEARLTEQRLGMSKVIGPALVAEQLARLKTAGATVRQAMTSPAVTVTATTPLADAARLMHARGLKRLPVVDAAGRLVGVLSRLDILGCVVAGGAHRTAPPSARLPQEHRTVAEIMDRDVPTVAATAPLGDVVERLLAAPTARVVVVDANGRPVGIVTDTDLLARVDPGERPGLLTLLRSRWSEAAAAEVRRHHGRRAADVMTAPVITVPTSASVLEALTLTVARHVKRLPVVDERGRVVGVVSRPALLAASLDLAPAGAIP
jgi:CBS-domain-containing membrane protein